MRKLEVVFCLDNTGSAGEFFRKEFIKNFEEWKACATFDAGINADEVDEFRAKFILFGDYETDEIPMHESKFYNLNKEQDEFLKELASVPPQGGGDMPENSLEALYYAFKSDWSAIGKEDRQVVMLITDAEPLPLGERSNCPSYPKDMVDLDGLLDMWNNHKNVKLNNAILSIFAPEDSSYHELYFDMMVIHRLIF